MRAENIGIEGDSLKAIFIYRTMIKQVEVMHRLTLLLHFGKNKLGNTILHIEPHEGHFYSRLVIRHMQALFS